TPGSNWRVRAQTPSSDLRVTSSGWIAYTKSVAGHLQARTRSPAGVDALASPYNDVALAGLNDLGEVVVDHPTGRAVGSPALSIGGSTGTMKYFAGDWY